MSIRRLAAVGGMLVAAAAGSAGAQDSADVALPTLGSRVRVTLRFVPLDPLRPSASRPSARVVGTLLRADARSVALRTAGRREEEFQVDDVLRIEVPRPGMCRGSARRVACGLVGALGAGTVGWLYMDRIARQREEGRARRCTLTPDMAECMTDYGRLRRRGAAVGMALGLAVGWGAGQDRWTPWPAWPPGPR